MNQLFFGDNLKDESVDLVYLEMLLELGQCEGFTALL